MELEWKRISDFGDMYEVSNTGIVRSWYRGKPRVRKLYRINSGYLTVQFRLEGDIKTYLVHRLVAEYFIGEIPANMQVDHIDGNKDNNCVGNLRVVTPADNQFNIKKYSNKKYSSKYKGVCKRASGSGRMWRAGIKINGCYTHIGSFDTEEEAAQAYNKVVQEISMTAVLNEVEH